MHIIKLRGLKLISKRNLNNMILGIFLGCLICSLLISQVNIPITNTSNNNTESNVKTSLDPIYDLTGTPIYIDNTDPANDWAAFQATYAWCTGDGSAFQPYTISQVLIDGPDAWYVEVFRIKNSDVHFSVTWCDIFGGKGIRLENVTNGELLYNNCSGGAVGISLTDSHDNLISNNDFRDNYYIGNGIRLVDSSFNEIYSNNILECERGIRLSNSHNNTIDNNEVMATEYSSLEMDDSNHNNITRNVLEDSNNIISLGDCDYNYIAHNDISDSGNYGVVVGSNSDYNTVYNNTIHDINSWGDHGIYVTGGYTNISDNIIERCYYSGIKTWGDFTTITGNTIDTIGENGIIIDSCSNFNVRDNVITNISEFGINLIDSESGDVLGNLLNGCGFNVDGNPSLMSSLNLDDSNQVNSNPVYFYESISGLTNGDVINAGQIILYSCYFGDFSNLNLNHATIGIALYYCDSTSISDSDFTYNIHSGIKLKSSNTTITNINAADNGNGILAGECDQIDITESTMSHNLYGINVYGDEYSIQDKISKIEDNIITYSTYNAISISGGDNFLINDNQIERNGASGIYLTQSQFNNISSNTLRYNVVAGIYLFGSANNTISANTASYNSDFGIKLTEYSNENSITKNTLTSNYNTTAKNDFISKGIEIYESGNNFVSENTMRNHNVAISIMGSFSITIFNNDLDDGANFQWSTYITFSKNLVTGPPMEANTKVYLYEASGCTFIENTLNWVYFRITGHSDYNYFIGNVISDGAYGFKLEDSHP